MKKLQLVAAIVAAATITACGGGGGSGAGGDTPAPQNLAGLWDGTTSNGRVLSAMTLSDGTTWALYTPIGGGNTIAGVVQGNINGAARDFNFELNTITDGTLSANITPKQSISGTVSGAGGSLSFTGNYDADFEKTPSLAALAGTFTGQSRAAAGVETATVTVDANGAITGTSVSGCSYTGTATPRTDGNAFNISVTFAGGVCALGTSTVTGVAFFDATEKSLIGAGLNSTKSDGFLFLGIKP